MNIHPDDTPAMPRSAFSQVVTRVRDQFDSAVILGILTSLASLVVGLVTALLIARYFSPEIQGYYYTFSGLLQLRLFVDAGLGQAIIQFASHEWSHLNFNADGSVTGSPDALSRLVSLGRFSLLWYGIGGVVLVLGLSLGGYLFFSKAGREGIDWMWPWFTLCLITGINFIILPVFSLVQGANQMAQYWGYRLTLQILYGVSLWVGILGGARLWTLTFAAGMILVWSVLFLRWRFPKYVTLFFAPDLELTNRIDWRKQVWPVQWRIGLSWLSGYFVTNLFAPILFSVNGSVLAGQVGMMTTLTGILFAASGSFVDTKGPQMGMLIAHQHYRQLDRLFRRSLISSILAACTGAIGIVALIYVMNLLQLPLAQRILPPLPAALFVGATILNVLSYALSIYLRAHKREPLAGVAILSMILVGLSIMLLGGPYGGLGAGLGNLAVAILIQTPLTVIIFFRSRIKWHGSANNILQENMP